MSVLKKYRDAGEEERESVAESGVRIAVEKPKAMIAVPNRERKSPIVSFSFTTELRSCLQDVRNERAINRSKLITILAQHEERNRIVMELAQKAYDKGRNVLVLGERLEQLYNFHSEGRWFEKVLEGGEVRWVEVEKPGG